MRISYQNWTPPHVSHSTINGWLECGMRTKLQKVDKIEQRPGLAATGGNAIHTATELFDQRVGVAANAEVLFLEGWKRALEKNKEWSPSYEVGDYIITGKAAAQYGGKRNIDWWMDNGPLMVQRWIEWREANPNWHIWETPDGPPAIELELNIELPNQIPTKIFIDRVMVTPVGQLTVVDIKTGRSPETPEQLGLYATAVEQTYGAMFRPDWGYWWDAQKGTHSSPLDLSRYTAAYLADRYAQAINGINAGVFLARPANSCANWCGVSHACPAVSD